MKRLLTGDETIVFENRRMIREIAFHDGKPQNSRIIRKESGYCWENAGKPVFELPGFDREHVTTEYDADTCEFTFHAGYTVKWRFIVPKDGCFITTQLSVTGQALTAAQRDGVTTPEISERVGHASRHVRLKRIDLRDRTDGCDSLVREDTAYLYRSREAFDGRIFILTDPTQSESVVIIKEAPCRGAHLAPGRADLYADCSDFAVSGTGIDYTRISPDVFTDGYPVTVAVCRAGEEEHTVRDVYARGCGNLSRFLMSNTWGDRSRNANVNEGFIKREILCAEQIGVDTVQIDDGWQTGLDAHTAPGGTAQKDSYDKTSGSYWEPDPRRFPSGFDRLCEFARERKIEVGLWFAPNEKDGYAHAGADADTLVGLYRRYGVRRFKIDGVDIPNKTAEANFLYLCEKAMRESDGRIAFNMDITADRRPGYLYHRELGTLFVENRYTDWSNYYPHNTLRNLWQLSRYIPAGKLQFEVLNPTRNPDKYPADDVLSPRHYRTDYLFATVMVAQPLLWMEMQNLPGDELARLRDTVRVWKAYRDDFREVIPRGECPDGFSLTGFEIIGEKRVYYIGIRENTDACRINLPVDRILCTDDGGLSVTGDTVTFSAPRRFFFAALRAPFGASAGKD